MTNITFCRFCFILGSYCRCHPKVPQAPTPLWNPPGYSYATMATVTMTSASTSMVGVPTVADPPPGNPALPLSMDTNCHPRPLTPWPVLVLVEERQYRQCWPQSSHQALIGCDPKQASNSRPPQPDKR